MKNFPRKFSLKFLLLENIRLFLIKSLKYILIHLPLLNKSSFISLMAVEQTLENRKTLECCKTLGEEILHLDKNPVIKSVEMENPSRIFHDSGEILCGSILESVDSDEVSRMDEDTFRETVVFRNSLMEYCKSSDVIVAQVTKTLGFGGIVGNIEFETSVVNCSRLDEVVGGCLVVVDDDGRTANTVGVIPEAVLVKNPVSDCRETGGMVGGSLMICDAQVAKSVDEVTKTMQVENSISDCCETGGMVGGSSAPKTMQVENSVSDCCGSSVVCGAHIVESVDEIPETMQVENSVTDCCETGGVKGVVPVNDDAHVAKSLDEIPEIMQLENSVSDCCETGGTMGVFSVHRDAQNAESLDGKPETMQLENPASKCCETGGIIGGSFLIDDDHVAKTLEETAQFAKTLNECIQDGVVKVEDVQLGKTLEECNTDVGGKIDNVKFDETIQSSSDNEDNDKEVSSVDELFGKSISCGIACGQNDMKFDRHSGPLSQYRQKQCDCRQCIDRGSISKHCDCDRCSYGEDNYECSRMMGHPLNPYSHLPNHPYFHDPHMFPYYGNRDSLLRRRMGCPRSEREHKIRMRRDIEYRMYHRNQRRFMRPDCMEEDAEDSFFYDRHFMNRRHSFVDSESRWNPNSFWEYPEPEPCPVGAGLLNLGNTCFLNAIIQCFTHTVPLVEGLQSLKHDASSHGQDEFCALCAVRQQIERSLTFSGKITSPSNLVDNLNHISSDFRRYQQEDAHDFLMSLLDKLDSNWSKHEANIGELSSSPDSLVKQLFGGRLVSQLRCCECGHNSDSYEPMIDMSLEIEDVDDLGSALKSFTKVENLQDTEKIRCDGCKEKVLAEKQLLLDQAPPVAALHLKRFKSDGFHIDKIDRKVKYPLELNLEPYTKGAVKDNEALKYELYGFVVHVGYSPIAGHYFCYVRTSPDAWYRFDDSKVTKVSESTALNQEAYILFYARKGTPWFSDFLDKWKVNLEEKSNTSPKSVLNSTNLPSTSFLGETLHGCQDSGKIDTASVTYVQPLSCLRLDDVDKESIIPANTSCFTASSEPNHDDVSANKAEVDVQAEVTAGGDHQIDETGRTKSETCSIISDVGNTFVDDVDINPCISFEPGSPDSFVDENDVDINPCISLEPGSPDTLVDDYDVDINPCISLEPGNPDTFIGDNDVDINPCISLERGSPNMCSDKEEPAAEEVTCISLNHIKVEEKASISIKNRLRKAKQVSQRKEAAKYLKYSSMPGGRCKTLMATISKKRRKHSSLTPKQCPKKRTKCPQ